MVKDYKRRKPSCAGLQSAIYKKIHPLLHVDTFHKTIAKRLCVLSPSTELPRDFDFMVLKNHMSRLPASKAFALVRTLSNGWTTSSRMHEPCIRSCFFGCHNSRDELAHYLSCTRLWRSVKSVLKPPLIPLSSDYFPLILGDTLEKLVLREFSSFRVNIVVAVSFAYHHMRNQHLATIDNLHRSGDVSGLASLLREILSAAFRRVI